MDYLKSGLKTVLGTSETENLPSAAETVERLVDRITSSTLLDDRRDACRALKALSRKYRLEVGAQGMSSLVQVLKDDQQDLEIVFYALDTLCNIISAEEFEEEAENPKVSYNVGEQFTEMFIKFPDNVTCVMDFLEVYDFRVRRSAIQLLTSLISHKLRELQELILTSPMGVSKLMDLLTDTREIIRNDALLLLIELTKSNSNIQKIVAFENAFDKTFEIIGNEGFSDGGIVVEDCLILILNLLKNNTSNQLFFKEGCYIQRLTPMFNIGNDNEEHFWTPQKSSNIHCMLQVVRALVTPSNQQQVITSCQKVMRQTNLLQSLCDILMSSGIPADILTETINSVAEIVRGDNVNQVELSKIMAPSNPPRAAIIVLLMSMINEKQSLSLRCAVLYCFQSYLYRNEAEQQKVVETLLPLSAADVSSVSTGQLLCTGLFSKDTLANWFCAVGLLHTLIENATQKEQLLRVLLASTGAEKPITLLEQCTNIIQQDNCKLQTKVGILMLLSVWLAHCPMAVKILLSTDNTISYLTAQISTNEQYEYENLVQGLSAFLMGLCIQFNDNSLAGQTREDISQLIIKRVGYESFGNKLIEVSRHEAYSRACKQPQIRIKTANELMLDYEFCRLYKSLEAHIGKAISGYNANNIELAELALSPEAVAIVAQYKGIIRDLDVQLRANEQRLNASESKNKELSEQIVSVSNANKQLVDQITLLKAQLAVHNGNNQDANVEDTKDDATQMQRNSVDNLQLAKELEMVKQLLEAERQRAERATSELSQLQKDQEDLLELLAEQDTKIQLYEKQIAVTSSPSSSTQNTNIPNDMNAGSRC